MNTTPFFRALSAMTLAVFLVLPQSARAAALADNHTLLYYLIEMQRQQQPVCNGQRMPQPPSLIPSDALRSLAASAAGSGQPLSAAAEGGGLAGIPFMAVTAQGGTPQQALHNLVANQCSALMGAEYRYIGASANAGQWTLIMAAAEPGGQVASPPPRTEGTTVASPAPAPQPVAVHPTPAAPTRPAETVEPGAEPKYAGPSEDAAAKPYVIGEMEVSHDGRPVGSLVPVAPPRDLAAPTARPALPTSRPAPADAPGNSQVTGSPSSKYAGPSENAPATPYVVGEVQVDGAGKPVGPVAKVPPPSPAPATAGGFTPPAPVTAPPTASAEARPVQIPSREAEEAPFTPPSGPGPLGRVPSAAAPDRQNSARPGVVALQDSRPQQPAEDLSFGVFADGATPTAANAGSAPVPAAQTASGGGAANDLLPLINAVRARGRTCGGEPMPPAPALRQNPQLSSAAHAHAQDMCARHYFSSTSPEGRTLGKRVSDTGYVWGFVAEDIASGSDSAQLALESWLADAKQCRNLMGKEYSEAGVGHDPTGRLWVFTLASPMEEGALRMR